jgi:hypothetical protein
VAGARADLIFAWPTLGGPLGTHTLLATAVLAGDGNPANDRLSAAGRVTATGIAPAPLTAAGRLGGYCGAVALTGNVIVAGFGASLQVLSDNGVSGFSPLGSVRLPGVVQAVAVCGSYAYTANGNGGVHVVDLSALARPRHVVTFNTSGHASAVAACGDRLFVADGSAGLRVLDVSAPAAPAVIGAWRTEGPARGVAVVGNTAYVVDASVGLLVLDVSVPAAIRRLGVCKSGFGTAVAAAGSHVCLVDGAGKFVAINVANPTGPVVAGGAQVLVLDAAAPLAPVKSVTISPLVNALRATAAGGYVYAGEDEAGAAIVALAARPGLPIIAAATAPLAIGAPGFVLRWTGTPGQSYTILKSTKLANGFAPIASGIPAGASVNSYTDAVTTAAAFYMVKDEGP